MLNLPIPISEIGEDEALARDVQGRLARAGYLDPPPDGKVGAVTQWAVAECARRHGISPTLGLTAELHELMAEPRAALPEARRGPRWVLAVIARMQAEGHWICRHPGAWNIVYVEGVDDRGRKNDNRPNHFNDVRLIFRIEPDGAVTSHAWEATSEPGHFWTMNPMDARGAARIAFGQWKAWVVGTHLVGRPGAHEALTQAQPIDVHRDLNRDFNRAGDRVFSGVFGINQHWGYDLPKHDIGKASAGCLVGRTKDGHRAFMKLVKGDVRFKASRAYRFVTTVLDGAELDL